MDECSLVVFCFLLGTDHLYFVGGGAVFSNSLNLDF